MNSRRLLQLLRLPLLAVVLWPALVQAEESQVCSDRVISSLKATLKIAGTVRASACKAWPDDKSKTLVAIAYQPPNYPESTNYELPVHIVKVTAGLRVLSHYAGSLSEDAVTRIESHSLRFDTARYFLTRDIRAFGLKVTANVEPRYADGGADDYLYLYVAEGNRIRPIMTALATRRWTYQDGVRANGERIARTTTYTLKVADTSSNGFADLLVTARTSGNKKVRLHKLRYDGKSYPGERELGDL